MTQAKVRFFYFRPEVPFWGKYGLKNQNCEFKLKFGTWTNWNMQNSMMMFTFSVSEQIHPFWANVVQKTKVVSLSWNVVARLNGICRIRQWCSLFMLNRNYPFWANLVQKIKIISLSWNFVLELIRVRRIQWWCSLFPFSTGNTLFGLIWCQNSKLFV